MIPPRPSRPLPAPKRKQEIIIEPNQIFVSIEDAELWAQTNIPGGFIKEIVEVKGFRCKVIPPAKQLAEFPNICQEARLYSFKTEKELEKFNEGHCGHLPILAKWECKFCFCWHYWGTAATDTNGGCLSGSFRIKPYLQKLIERTIKAGTLAKTFERSL